MSQPQNQPLATKDANARPSNDETVQDNPFMKASKPVASYLTEGKQQQSLHRKLMDQQRTGQQTGQYVSPSDGIMSPMSQKLSSYKQGRLAKAPAPKRNLFARTPSMVSSTDLASESKDAPTSQPKANDTTMSED